MRKCNAAITRSRRLTAISPPAWCRRRESARAIGQFLVNRRAESEIQMLARKMNQLIDKVDDVEDLIRKKPN